MTKEARDIFWTSNTFYTGWKQIGLFALGFGTPPSTSYFIPRDHVRRLKIDLLTPEADGDDHGRACRYENPSVVLRQLLEFPALQHVELVILMSLSDVLYNNPMASAQVGQIKDVCTKLIRRFGRGFSVCLEASLYVNSSYHPYLWQYQPVQNLKVSPEDAETYDDLYYKPEDHGEWITNRSENHSEHHSYPIYLLESATYFREPYPPPHDGVTCQRDVLTWMWKLPIETTLEKVRRGRGNWMEKINVQLFQSESPA